MIPLLIFISFLAFVLVHAAPGGQTGDNIDDSFAYPFLFESAESQELTVNLWAKIATRYRNEPAVI